MNSDEKYIESGSHQALTLNGSAPAWRQQMQLSFYGIYIIHVSTDSKTITQKIVVQH